jgi:uncharacterized glyoxalase superfamily protein PhnB
VYHPRVEEVTMKPTPPGWPRISSALYYDDANAAIDWLCRAFGFEVRIKVPGEGGQVMHSELTFGEGLIMVAEGGANARGPVRRSPRAAGGWNTQNMMIYVDDVEAHLQRAKAAGATIATELTVSDYGEDYWSDRSYECVDPGGHHWWIAQRLRTGKST